MVDGFSTAALRRDNMTFGGDTPGGDFSFGWDDSTLMDFNPNDELQRILNPFVCTCHGTAFPKKADLNRHIAKETRRFLCDVSDCPSTQNDGSAPVFGTLNDKKRHYRDVHGTDLNGRRLPKFVCPWTNCKRHTDGFPRPKNLENHLKSLHDNQRPDPVVGADVSTIPSASQPVPAPVAEGASSAPVSFSAPPLPPNAPLADAFPAPSLIPGSSLDLVTPTPPDSQHTEAIAAAEADPLPTLTETEAAVLSSYEENISALNQENESRSTHLATIERELASMQDTCSTIKRQIAENHATAQFLETQLEKRKQAIRASRTLTAQRRMAAAAAAATAATPGAATSPPMQSE